MARLNVSLPPTLQKLIREQAKREERSVSALVRRAVRDYLDRVGGYTG